MSSLSHPPRLYCSHTAIEGFLRMNLKRQDHQSSIKPSMKGEGVYLSPFPILQHTRISDLQRKPKINTAQASTLASESPSASTRQTQVPRLKRRITELGADVRLVDCFSAGVSARTAKRWTCVITLGLFLDVRVCMLQRNRLIIGIVLYFSHDREKMCSEDQTNVKTVSHSLLQR